MKGAAVCHKHGGSAPQVRRKAAERIANASDIAVLQILRLMQEENTPAPVKLAAAKDLLDRADVKGKTTVELEVKPWEQLLDGVVGEVPADTPYAPFADLHEADPLVVEAHRVDAERALENHAPDDKDWSAPWASGAEPPPPPIAKREPAKRVLDGDDGPPPARYSPTPPPPKRGRAGRLHR
ncbi:hypothetical protein [Modestobacter sp. SYSU DS0290]